MWLTLGYHTRLFETSLLQESCCFLSDLLFFTYPILAVSYPINILDLISAAGVSALEDYAAFLVLSTFGCSDIICLVVYPLPFLGALLCSCKTEDL